MALQYTGDSLIKLIRDKGMLPDTGSTGTSDADILEHVNAAFIDDLFPFVVGLREEYFVVHEKIPVSGDQEKYRIPPRAGWNKLRDVYYQEGTSRWPLDSLPREDIPNWGTSTTGSPHSFYLEGNHIVLFPDLSGASGDLNVAYYFRPGQVQLQEDVAKIINVDTSTKTITCDTMPTSWTTATKYDVHSQYSGAEIHEWDLTAASVNTSERTIAFSEAIDGSTFGRFPVEVGDYVCIAEETALPGLPREAHPVLAQAALCRVLEALGDHENLQFQKGALDEKKVSLTRGLNARTESKPIIINNRNSLMQTNGGSHYGSGTFGARH